MNAVKLSLIQRGIRACGSCMAAVSALLAAGGVNRAERSDSQR
jgi:hypothetical protein